MMIERDVESVLRRMAGQFKAVAVTGPRQSGKTTLARRVFPNKPYVTLEAPDERAMALEDPRRFLDRFRDGGIWMKCSARRTSSAISRRCWTMLPSPVGLF